MPLEYLPPFKPPSMREVGVVTWVYNWIGIKLYSWLEHRLDKRLKRQEARVDFASAVADKRFDLVVKQKIEELDKLRKEYHA